MNSSQYLYSLNGVGRYTDEEVCQKLEICTATLMNHVSQGISYHGWQIEVVAEMQWCATHKKLEKVIWGYNMQDIANQLYMTRSDVYRAIHGEMKCNWIITKQWRYRAGEIKPNSDYEHLLNIASELLADYDNRLTEAGAYNSLIDSKTGESRIDQQIGFAHPVSKQEWTYVLHNMVKKEK